MNIQQNEIIYNPQNLNEVINCLTDLDQRVANLMTSSSNKELVYLENIYNTLKAKINIKKRPRDNNEINEKIQSLQQKINLNFEKIKANSKTLSPANHLSSGNGVSMEVQSDLQMTSAAIIPVDHGVVDFLDLELPLDLKKIVLSYENGWYTHIFNSYLAKQEFDGAYRVYTEMKASEVHPDEVIFTSLINLFMAKGDLEGTYRIFEDMKAAKVPFNTVIYTSLVNFLIKHKDKRASRIIEEMELGGANVKDLWFTYYMSLFQ